MIHLVVASAELSTMINTQNNEETWQRMRGALVRLIDATDTRIQIFMDGYDDDTYKITSELMPRT